MDLSKKTTKSSKKESLLDNIIKYNKENNMKFKKILNLKKDYQIQFKNNIIKIFFNEEKVLVGNYIFFGVFEPVTSLWIWSPSIPGTNKKNNLFVNNIRDKKYLFEKDGNKDMLFLYQFLNEDVIKITNLKYLKLISQVLNFLSNSLFIFNPNNNKNNMEFIGLTKIKENYI
jgi:hypothetical protein